MTGLTLAKLGTGALVALVFLMESAAAQTSVTIGALKDNSLYESATGSFSNGTGIHMFVGKTNMDIIRRALLSFDIAANVPAGSIVDSVKLTLNFNKTVAPEQPVELHKVLTDWGEGTTNASGQEGMGGASTTGSATWIHTFFSTGFWTTPGGDFSATVSGSRMIGDATQVGLQTWNSTAGMVADVQDWLDNPSTNFGWALVGNESTFPTTKRFSTKEDANVANRPSLTIFFHQSIPCGDITSIGTRCIGGGTKTIQVRVNLLNNIIHTGEPVTITIDGTPFTATIISNGTHSRANFSISGWSVGTHTVSLVDPPGCLADKHPECVTFARIDPEWDDIDWTAPTGNAPQTTELLGNYPNPFNPSTTIRYNLGHDGWVTLRIYNTIGQVIATLVDQFEDAGYKSVVWNGRNSAGEEVAAGVYMYMIKAGELVRVERMIVVK